MLKEFSIGKELSIEGQFNDCHFSNKDNYYYVYDFTVCKIINNSRITETSESIKVMGYFDLNDLQKILKCRLAGKVTDYKGEKQFEVHDIEVLEPVTTEEIISFLSSSIFKNIDFITAQKIVEGYYDGMFFRQGFGENTIDIIKDNPAFLTRIKGISKTKAESIHRCYIKQMEYQNIAYFLKDFNLSESKIIQAYKHFKEKTIEVIRQNAFNLSIIKGFDFEICEKIAKKIRQEAHCLQRVEMCILFILKSVLDEGHCYLEMRDLVNLAYKKLNQELSDDPSDEVTNKEIENAVHEMIRTGTIRYRENTGNWLIYMDEIFNAEVTVADAIKRLSVKASANNKELELDNFIKEFEMQKGLFLEDMQKQALRMIGKFDFLVLTGSAGSGKTTTVEGILYILGKMFNYNEVNTVLTAPTGKAAKRLSEVTGYEAKTLHRLLEYSKDGFCKYCKDNTLEYKVVIVDEAAMIDIILARNLLTAIKEGTKVILLGDIEQLPSVGAGKFLSDIISSSIVPLVRLNVIKRQLETSGIVLNSNRIINGDIITSHEKQKDFFIIEEENEYEIVNKILKSIKRLTDTKHRYRLNEIQVICPQKMTFIGTHELNRRIQMTFNAPSLDKREVPKGKVIFRMGDRVIHLNNDYEAKHYKTDETVEYTPLESTGVFNGDIGEIIDIFKSNNSDEEENGSIKVAVRYDAFIIIYKKNELENIDLAYALTVHKMQGSQCKVAIIPIHMKNKIMLYRNLGYTAITRASEIVCIIGQTKAIAYMTKNIRIKERNSTLGYLLKEA